ncbi:YopX family protein [Bacteroides sp.]|uniref:YopX family protein n=1 Tax=Bacteroides sp. TaxID=29523 RepID=UPI002607903B|nr:YopX family protein [Bacteroides sp.]MDD3038847.1 YopX family protein [Bacteroides sp.]
MRIIKFRGKTSCLDNNEWVYGDLHIISKRPHIHSISSNCPLSIDVNTVGQFTGLLDKNGKEIYEGDIIGREHNEIKVAAYVIEYIEGGLYARSVISGAVFQMSIKSATNDRYYIIGNIHDNPELLKGSKE